MTTEEIDRRLVELGVTYDLDTCRFYDGNRQLDSQDVRGLLPDLSEEEIEKYQEAKIDECDQETLSYAYNVCATGDWEVSAVPCTKCGGNAAYKTHGHLYEFNCPNCHTSESGTFYPGPGEAETSSN
jgi:hypothetical protein